MEERHKKILLGILVELDRVCNQHGLRYFLTGGSMIGAVRHKGMIPWDDDIDVAMPRDDYERLKLIANEAFDKDFELIHTGNNDSYFWRFAKLCHKKTTLVEIEYPFCIEGVFVDVFPLDGLPDNMADRIKHYNRYDKRLRELCLLYQPPKQISFKTPRRFLSSLKSKFYHMVYSYAKLVDRCESVAKKFSYEESNYIVNFAGIYGIKEITQKKFFSDYILMDFEGYKLRVPIGYDGYLTGVYGNYMELPPLEKRTPHHKPYYLDLDKKLTKEQISRKNCSCNENTI